MRQHDSTHTNSHRHTHINTQSTTSHSNACTQSARKHIHHHHHRFVVVWFPIGRGSSITHAHTHHTDAVPRLPPEIVRHARTHAAHKHERARRRHQYASATNRFNAAEQNETAPTRTFARCAQVINHSAMHDAHTHTYGS